MNFKTNKKKIYTPSLVIGLIFFFDEIILKQGTMQGSWFPEIFYIFFGSLFFGYSIEFLTSLSNYSKLNKTMRIVLVTGITIVFIINYFVYKMFKIFYDINTIFAGAGGAISEFQDLILGMIFSASGFTHLMLFLIPCVFYIWFTLKVDTGTSMRESGWKPVIIGLIASLFIDSCGIYLPEVYRNMIHAQYSFQTAINSFGLLSGITLDVVHLFVSSSDFEDVEEIEESAEPAPIIYEGNTLDINFEQLAENADGVYQEMDEYVASISASHQNEYTGLFRGKNLIMITAEAFSGEIIDEELTPTLYRLATKGIQFTDYYQPASAGTTGGEYEIIFGALPTSGGSSFKNMTKRNNYMTIGSQLSRLGYTGYAFHNNTYTFYDRNKTHNAIGYSEGFMGLGNGMEEYVTKQWPESDLEMMEGTIPLYIDKEPFNIYYMSVSGHNDYSKNSNAMSKKNWDRVKDLDYSDRVKAYIACQLELEDALTYLLEQLEEVGLSNDTVIVLSADHFPYGLDEDAAVGNMPYLSELYGYDVTNYMERDHNTLIIWSGILEKLDPIVVDTPVSSLDILPTLSNLFGTEYDSRLFVGRDVFSETEPLVFNMNYDWKTEKGTYYAWTNTFVANEGITIENEEKYVKRINKIVKNKMTYCKDYQSVDYFKHLFGKKKKAK